MCKKVELLDGATPRKVINFEGQPASAQCTTNYQNTAHWTLTGWVQTCPIGWTRGTNNTCVDAANINGSCSVCANPFSCQVVSGNGKCALAEAICPSGSTCNPGSNKCEKPDQGTCDCCCNKNDNITDPVTGQTTNPGCCAGLSCDGSCGSQQANLGLCSGCVVNGEPDDSLCNCTGTTGKFCDASVNPRGVCKDCGSITDPAECSRHGECCVDGKNGGRCTSLAVGGARIEDGGLQYCAYYNCTNAYPNACNALNPVINGVYNKINSCNLGCTSAAISCANEFGQCDKNSPCPANMRCDALSCECKSSNPGPGAACRDPLTQACTGSCAVGYQCLLPTGYGNGSPLETGPETSGPGDDSCRCCCKPPKNEGDIDTCKDINPNLNCLADQGACTSPTGERGLCCGCSKDSECGDVATTGCGLTGSRCCQTRPSVTEHLPAPDTTGVCRNPVIEATFNQKMDIASFGASFEGKPNVSLIGDYGASLCPSGFSAVASGPRSDSRFAALTFKIKSAAVKLLPILLTRPAFAEVSNYCYVPGTAIGYDFNAQSKVSFRLNQALDKNIRYYVVLRGDADLEDLGQGEEKDYYNANIVNTTKIGLMGVKHVRLPEKFNSTEIKNSEVWSFATGNDICALDRVSVTPGFQLFQQSGQTGSLESKALDKNNRAIQTLPGVYAWTWNWSSDNAEVAKVEQASAEYQATATAGNKQDAQTLARAKATITVDTMSQPTTVGQSREGTAQLRVFLCENPWPVYYSENFPPGYNWPWQDSLTGIEFYYCRDKSGVGTIDDLPALVDAPIVKEGANKICMYGQNVGRSCNSDANCGSVSGSCLPEVLKEFFFFRENEPGIPSLEGSTDPLGTKINLSWGRVPNAVKYKIYYGLNPGQYTFTTEVASVDKDITKTIEGLVNGINYYFAITAISSKNQESVYSNVVKIKPADTTPPAVPQFQASAGNGKISLFWQKVPEAVSYIAYLGVAPRGPNGSYTVSSIVRTDPLVNNPNVIFTSINNSGLNNASTYYLSVRSVDQYGNISDYAPEIVKRPNQPYLISLTPANGSITPKWLPFIGATGYTVYYGNRPGATNNSVDVSATTFERKISGLTNGTTYYFTIKALLGDQSSDSSNERSVAPVPSNDQ